MKITNKSKLPQAIFEAISAREYDNGGADISVTTLIDSPRVAALKKIHDADIEVEAGTLLASTIGNLFHEVIAKGTKTGVAERRLFLEINGWMLSGGMDNYDDGILTDYKTCNKWKTILSADSDGRIEEFENQLNVYAHILRKNGHPVKKLMLFAYFKDWNKAEFSKYKKTGKIFSPGHQPGYPEQDWLHFEVPLWSEKKAESYVLERVRIHQDARIKLPLCSTKDIWRGTRCERYCSVAKFCSQYEEMSKTGIVPKGESESA